MSKKSSRSAQGAGTIRKKTITRNGKPYSYWEARITTGYDPGTGKQVQRSFSGKTQKEVREKMQAVAVELNNGTYKEPCKLTVGEWLDIWKDTYLNNIKPRTVKIYESDIRLHIKPALGAIRLETLNTHTIQSFYNRLVQNEKGKRALSPKTVKNIHGVLHHALNQAAANGIIRFNPADACTLPRIERTELKPLDEEDIKAFLKVIQGTRYEDIFLVTLFTGMREGEVLGLTWDCVDFEKGALLVNKQLQLHQEKEFQGAYTLASPKNGKSRTIVTAPFVMNCLKRRKVKQAKTRMRAGDAWSNPNDLVFTDEIGGHLIKSSVYREYKAMAKRIGRPDARFHDLRHSYAVAAISSGDDIKTVQGNLGHATAAFTLDVYGHVTNKMKRESASRMEKFIQSVSGA